MLRRGVVMAALLAGGAGDLAGQAGVVRGRVVRADGPVGLADVEVVLRPPGATTRTDARGWFVFRGIPEGPVEVAARRPGFLSATLAVRVGALGAAEVHLLLQPVAAILDPIVSTATRDLRSVSEVAAAVSVADTSAISRERTVGLNETLRMMPGVQARSRYGTDEVGIGIRGSAARSRQAVRGVAVLLDGIPLTESDGAARLDLIELAAARQIEVVRGPASALYAGSPGGVVNVVSRTGRDSRGVSVTARTGAFGFRKVDGQAGGVFAGGRGSGFGSVSYTSSEGYRAHSDGDVLRGQVAFDYTAGRDTRFVLEAGGSRLDTRLPGPQSLREFDADPDAAAPLALAFGFGRVDNRYRAGARVEQAAGAGAAMGYFFYGGRTLDFPIATGIVDLNLDRVQGGARFRSGRLAGSPLVAVIGVDYDDLFGSDKRWSNDGGARGALRDDGRFSVPSLGAYSQVEWQLSSTAGVTLGLRYDRVAYQFESETPGAIPQQDTAFHQLSPRLSAVWSPAPETSLYASVGRGFEVPVIGEISMSPGTPLRSVRPKSLWNYEVGARRVVGGRMLLEGSVFYADVRGEFVPVNVSGQSVPENASRSRNIGVELGLSARMTPRLELGAAYTFLDLRLQEFESQVLDSTGTLQQRAFGGKLLPGVPRHRATGEVRARPLAAVALGVQMEWQSVVYVETNNAAAGTVYFRPQPSAPVQQAPFRAVPAGVLVHVNAAWRLGPATLFGSIENLFGRRHAGGVVANDVFGRFYEAGPPASVSVGLRVGR